MTDILNITGGIPSYKFTCLGRFFRIELLNAHVVSCRQCNVITYNRLSKRKAEILKNFFWLPRASATDFGAQGITLIILIYCTDLLYSC